MEHEVAMCSRDGTGYWEAGEGTSRHQIVAVMGLVTAVIGSRDFRVRRKLIMVQPVHFKNEKD